MIGVILAFENCGVELTISPNTVRGRNLKAPPLVCSVVGSPRIHCSTGLSGKPNVSLNESRSVRCAAVNRGHSNFRKVAAV